MIRVHGASNTRAFRVLWMLEELGVPYEQVKVDFHTGATRSPEFLRLNPNGRVPVLEDRRAPRIARAPCSGRSGP